MICEDRIPHLEAARYNERGVDIESQQDQRYVNHEELGRAGARPDQNANIQKQNEQYDRLNRSKVSLCYTLFNK